MSLMHLKYARIGNLYKKLQNNNLRWVNFVPSAQDNAYYCQNALMQSKMFKYTGYYVTVLLKKILIKKNMFREMNP